MAPDADTDLFLGDASGPDEAWAKGNFGVSQAAIRRIQAVN